MNKIVFLVAGGTGGHLFPAMALSSEKIRAKLIYLVDKRTKKFLENKNQDFIVIPSEKIHKNVLKFPKTCIKIISGILISLFYILKKKTFPRCWFWWLHFCSNTDRSKIIKCKNFIA